MPDEGISKPASSPRYHEHYSRYRRRSFCNQWGHFCQKSTFHGLADVYRAPNSGLRVFWLITFMGALGASVYGCYAILHQYLESPVVASYFIHEAPARFALPDLVVCPFNRFNAEFLEKYNISTDLAQYMQLTFGPSAKHPAQRRDLDTFRFNASLVSILEEQTNLTLQRLNMTFGQFLDAASLKCNDLFIDCVRPKGKFNCCENATDVMTFAGKCYRIGGVDQLGPGYGYGMSVVVSLPKKLYSLALNNWLNDGVLLKLAERNQGVDYDLTFVPVGTHALLPLKATRYEFINDPHRFECLEDPEQNYSRVDCFDTCFAKAAQQDCNCVIVTNIGKYGLPPCTTSQFLNCVVTRFNAQFKSPAMAENHFYKCRQECSPRCNYFQYTSLISYSKFPSENARNFTHDDQEWIRMKNTIIIDVYYEKLEYTLIKHYKAMSIHGFIANLGGQYSLWLGGSILTLVQLIVFLINYTFWRCVDFRAKRSPEKMHEDILKSDQYVVQNGTYDQYKNICDQLSRGGRSISPNRQTCILSGSNGLYTYGEPVMGISTDDDYATIFRKSIQNSSIQKQYKNESAF